MSDVPIQKGVRGGGFCGPLGSKGETTAQTDVTCTLASDGKGRWKLTPGAETAKERKRREARGNKPKRGSGRRRATLNSVGAAPTALPAALTPVPAAVPAAVPAPHPDPDAMLDNIPLDVQREIERRAGGDPAKAEELADAYLRDGELPGAKRAPSPEEVRTDMNALGDAAKAREYLDGKNLTAGELRDLAKGLDIHVPPGATKDKLASDIVQWTVGRRLASEAISRPNLREVNPVKPIDMSRRNDGPLSENMWGAGSGYPVSYHPDGDWGRAVDALGADARVDYDGLPLKEHLDRTATEVIRGEKTTNDAIAELRRVRDRLPADSRAHRVVDGLIEDIDHPMTPAPQVPEGAHPAFAQLAQDLHSVPAARRDTTEIERVLEMARQSAARPNRNPRLWASDLERQVHNLRHESNGAEGKFDIDRAVRRAVRALEGTR